MEDSKVIRYGGETYRVQGSCRYFMSDKQTAPERLLHRRIWIENNGAIPEGYVIHHIDGDRLNNNLENLACVPRGKHLAKHMQAYYAVEENKEANRQQLYDVRELASEWHGSAEGKEWHSDNSKAMWKNKTPGTSTCQTCGKVFETWFPTRAKFCSNACEQKGSYSKHKTEPKVCPCCGKEFLAYRYKPVTYCSKKCSNSAIARGFRIQSDT